MRHGTDRVRLENIRVWQQAFKVYQKLGGYWSEEMTFANLVVAAPKQPTADEEVRRRLTFFFK